MSATLKDIAKQLDLSHATISRVLTGKKNVKISPETRRRVLQTARDMGYSSNRLAKALVTGSTNTIALWMYEFYKTVYVNVIRHVRRELNRRSYETVILETLNQDRHEPALWDRWWPVDAVFAYDSPITVKAFIERHKSLDVPIISTGVFCCKEVDHIEIDLYSSVVEALRYMVRKGRRRIAYIATVTGDVAGDPRFDAYALVMHEAGLPEEHITIDVNDPVLLRRLMRRGIRDYIQAHKHPDALLCCNDETAISVYSGLRDIGLRIPEDVAILGIDGIEDTEYLDPPLSTIVLPFEELASMSWKFLERRLQDRSIPKQEIVLKSQLIIRGSLDN